MDPWAAPAAAASILLIVTGVTKAVRPDASADALPLSASPRVSSALARALGGIEVAVGLWVVVTGDRAAAAAMAALFVGFAGFAFHALRSGVSSCGCTGASDAPPTVAHIVMNVAFAMLAGLAAGTSAASPGDALVRNAIDPVGGVVVVMTVTVVWLAWMVLGSGALQSLARGQGGRTT